MTRICMGVDLRRLWVCSLGFVGCFTTLAYGEELTWNRVLETSAELARCEVELRGTTTIAGEEPKLITFWYGNPCDRWEGSFYFRCIDTLSNEAPNNYCEVPNAK